jgi:hypothetical protein
VFVVLSREKDIDTFGLITVILMISNTLETGLRDVSSNGGTAESSGFIFLLSYVV